MNHFEGILPGYLQGPPMQVAEHDSLADKDQTQQKAQSGPLMQVAQENTQTDEPNYNKARVEEGMILPEHGSKTEHEVEVAKNIAEDIFAGSTLRALTIEDGNYFKLPAALLKLPAGAEIEPIVHSGLSTFVHKNNDRVDIEPANRMHVYMRYGSGKVAYLGYGDIQRIRESLPGYVEEAYPKGSEVKEVVIHPKTKAFALKSMSKGFKSFSFTFNSWF